MSSAIAPSLRPLRPLYLSIALLVLACDGEPTGPAPTDTPEPTVRPTPQDTAPPTPVDTGTTHPTPVRPPCTDLALDPPGPLVVEVEGQRFFSSSGGTGQPLLAVDPPEQGTITNVGLFTAGSVEGTVEVVLEDVGCIGQATASVDVVAAMQVAPVFAEMLPSTTLPINVTGGSGTASCSLIGVAPGTLQGCSFTSDSSGGTAVIEVVDDLTGSLATVTLVVSPDAGLSTRAQTGWMAPVGSAFDPEIAGGSGQWVLAPGTPTWVSTVLDPLTGAQRLQASVSGMADITLEDATVPGLSLTRTLHALDAHVPPTHPSGANSENPRVLEEDLDGDGLPELIVADKDASVGFDRGGVVRVYAGAASGFELSTPLWTLDGQDDLGSLGASIALGDLDGDGVSDLVVGAPQVNWISDRVGEVSVYLGDGAGGFITPPAHVYNGQRGADRIGCNVAVCDLDGDGLNDLVSSSESLDLVTNDRSGAIWFWQQDALGLPLVPEIRMGARFDGTDWVSVGNGRLGTWDLAVGDLDHDGRCDVVADMQTRDWLDATTGPGFVLMYSGDAAEGLSLEPTRVWHTTGDTAVRFGRSLAVGKVDDLDAPSGLPDDLLIGAPGWDGAGASYGRALLFPGGPGGALERTPADATWSLQGVGNNDQVGQGVGIAPEGDLVVSAPGERLVWRVPGGVDFTAGDVLIDALSAGVETFEPTVLPTDTLTWAGTYVAPVRDGVFLPSRLSRTAPDDSFEFVTVTGHHLIAPDGTTDTWTFDQVAGDQFGASLAWFDANGTGAPQLVVGGPEYAQPGQGNFAGGAFVDDGSWTSLPAIGPGFSANDRRATRMTTGDLNGDGAEDLLVGSRTDSRAATPSPALDVACGGGARNNVGHVAVYLGGVGGVGDNPDFMWWPPVAQSNINSIDSGFDANGDGFDDLIVGTRQQRVSLVYGQAAPPGGETHELCTDTTWTNTEGGEFGTAVAAIGDLDADGCDEIVVTAPNEDLGITNRGIARVLWGFGPTCDRTTAQFTVLARDRANERWGADVDGGIDLTGDGTPDLVISSYLRAVGVNRVGGADLLDGTALAALATAPAAGDVVPDAPLHPMADLSAGLVQSWEPSSNFGFAVAMLPTGVAVGMPATVLSSTGRGGGVAVFDVSNGQLEPDPAWWLAGESFSRVGGFGTALEASDGGLLIGAPGSDVNGQNHVGAAYVAPF